MPWSRSRTICETREVLQQLLHIGQVLRRDTVILHAHDLFERKVLVSLRPELADERGGDAVVAQPNDFFGRQLVVPGRLELGCIRRADAVIAQPDVPIETCH